MKAIKNVFFLSLIAATVLAVSCKKTDTNPDTTSLSKLVTGTYSGELKNSQTNISVPATLNVSALNDSMISMHCFANNFDTTLNMMLYENNDSIMMCFTGQDFYNEYGHNLDNHNFCNSNPEGWHSGWEGEHNNWWGNQNNMWNAWNNHMNTQHNQGDQHYGGFNPNAHNCNYSFKVITGNLTYSESFSGAIK
ncbi:MAG TPA: hypothetical protein VEP89_04825 [Draconibacterium sp.]|nr:hypothetical protein [Draconibacterium sp.]